MNETAGWYGDNAGMVNEDNSWFLRGGGISRIDSGIFFYGGSSGASLYDRSFRQVLTPNNN